jgi:hypothetical protein
VIRCQPLQDIPNGQTAFIPWLGDQKRTDSQLFRGKTIIWTIIDEEVGLSQPVQVVALGAVRLSG